MDFWVLAFSADSACWVLVYTNNMAQAFILSIPLFVRMKSTWCQGYKRQSTMLQKHNSLQRNFAIENLKLNNLNLAHFVI